MTHQRILDLFEQIDSTMWGPEEHALIGEAVALAVESGDEELEYQARMRLTGSAMHGGDTDAMLSSFAWCLAKYDSDPSRFPADIGSGGADLLWQYKWMAGALGSSPIFARAEIEAVLEDMREHYQRAGLGMSGVLTSQFEEAWANGRIEEAEALRVTLDATPRDDHSHCDACVRSQSAGFLAETGREDQAIVLVEEMIEGGFSCGDEPEAALGRALLPYLRAGRLDEAKTAHLRSYRLSRDNPDKISIVAHHLLFCAITGNEARGLAMLERHIGWLSHDGLNVSGHFAILVACGVLLDAVARAGHGDIPVRRADAAALRPLLGEHEGPWTVDDLSRACWAAAERIGASFDARNGNDYYAVRVIRARALESEHYELPIQTDTFVPAPVTRPEPTSGVEWLTRARELANLGDYEAGAEAARHATADTLGVDRDSAWSLLTGMLVRLERWDDAERALVQRGESLRENGRGDHADLEARFGLALFGRATDADLAAMEKELSNESLRDELLADLAFTLAMSAMSDEEPDPARALELVTRALEGFGASDRLPARAAAVAFHAHVAALNGDGDPARASIAMLEGLDSDRALLAGGLVLRARVHGGAGEAAEGAVDADAAVRLFLELDAPREAAEASALAAALFEDAGDYLSALDRYRFAVRQSELLGTPAAFRFSYGRALVRAGEAAAATEVLLSVYDEETAAEQPDASRAETLFWLGHAFTGDGQHGSAIGAWNQSIELFVSGDDLQGAARSGTAAGRLFSRFGEQADAIEVLVPALQRARLTPENLELLTSCLHALGTAQAGAGDAAGLDALDEVISIAEANDAGWLAADASDSKARALHALGRTEEAIPLALRAADGYRDAGDIASSGGSELFVGRVLAATDRREEAAAILASALEHAVANPQLESLVAIELGDLLEQLGRTDEAAVVRSRVSDS